MLAVLGKTGRQRRTLIKQEIALKFSVPAVNGLLIALLCIKPLNDFLNTFLLKQHLLLIATGCFSVCFLLIYAVYALVAYWLCVKTLDGSRKRAAA